MPALDKQISEKDFLHPHQERRGDDMVQDFKALLAVLDKGPALSEFEKAKDDLAGKIADFYQRALDRNQRTVFLKENKAALATVMGQPNPETNLGFIILKGKKHDDIPALVQRLDEAGLEYTVVTRKIEVKFDESDSPIKIARTPEGIVKLIYLDPTQPDFLDKIGANSTPALVARGAANSTSGSMTTKSPALPGPTARSELILK